MNYLGHPNTDGRHVAGIVRHGQRQRPLVEVVINGPDGHPADKDIHGKARKKITKKYSRAIRSILIDAKVRTRWVDQNLIANSLSSFRVSSYNCTTYRCWQFCFKKACKNVGGTFAWYVGKHCNELKMQFWSTQRGLTLAGNLYTGYGCRTFLGWPLMKTS